MNEFQKGVLVGAAALGSFGVLAALVRQPTTTTPAAPTVPAAATTPDAADARWTPVHNADPKGMWVRNSAQTPIFTKQLTTSNWQYEVVLMPPTGPFQKQELVALLQGKGEAGWELVGVTVGDHLIFKKSGLPGQGASTATHPSANPYK